ncbi:SAL1 phosphatase-like isoform X2 [Gossypium hirsutum]|uniref:SAL1 phosphatase-like isoform X2 n=1 Tax=Gossypium hirsutum TaxID=3635 RepID=A0ABM3C3K0_GOSHI|nr:SAL1 phosphatase-like isoform X2 [Gossypium hirsutum]
MNIKTKAFFAVLILSSSMVEAKAFMLQSLMLILTKSLLLRKIISMNVQKALLQSDVQSETDKTPLTVADYGSQAVVSFVLQQELHAEFSLVAKEDSKDLRKDGAQEIIKRITKLVNDSLTSDGSYNITLSTEDVLKAIDSSISEGGCQGRYWVLDPIDGTKGHDCCREMFRFASNLLLFSIEGLIGEQKKWAT